MSLRIPGRKLALASGILLLGLVVWGLMGLLDKGSTSRLERELLEEIDGPEVSGQVVEGEDVKGSFVEFSMGRGELGGLRRLVVPGGFPLNPPFDRGGGTVAHQGWRIVGEWAGPFGDEETCRIRAGYSTRSPGPGGSPVGDGDHSAVQASVTARI